MTSTKEQQGGFILVASIWMMAVLVLLVGAFALWVETSLNTAVTQNTKTHMHMHAASTQSVLLYLIATRSGTPAGISLPPEQTATGGKVDISLDDFLSGAMIDDMGARTVAVEGNELRVDGGVYRGIGGSLFSVRDLAGLIPINSPAPLHTQRLLQHIGMDEAQASQLYMTLQDYIDKDDVLRPNGAERFQYLQRGMPTPANAALLSRFELRFVLGWENLPMLWQKSDLVAMLSAASVTPYNINAIPAKVAEIMFDLSPEQIEVFMEQREQSAFVNVRDLNDRTGLNWYPYMDELKTLPSSDFRLSFWYPDARLKREIDIHFTTGVTADKLPWVVSRDIYLPITELDAFVEPRQPQTQLLR